MSSLLANETAKPSVSSVASLKAPFMSPPSETTIYVSITGKENETVEKALSCITFEESEKFKLLSIDRKPNLVSVVVVMEK